MWLSYLSMILLMLVGVMLIIIVLLQRGRGGGLAGALGGMGGQSAFGTKAGDVFTRITIVIAVIWVVLAGVSGFALRADANRLAAQIAGTPEAEESEAEDPPVGAAPSKSREAQPPGAPKGSKSVSTATEAKKDAAGTNGDAAPAAKKTEPPAAPSDQSKK